MGCNCGKRRTVAVPPASGTSPASARTVVTYDVKDSTGALVASSMNPAHARAEARKIGGTITSRSINKEGDA